MPKPASCLGVERGVPPSDMVRKVVTPTLDELGQAMADYITLISDKVGPLPPPPPHGAGEIATLLRRVNEQVGFRQAVADRWRQAVCHGEQRHPGARINAMPNALIGASPRPVQPAELARETGLARQRCRLSVPDALADRFLRADAGPGAGVALSVVYGFRPVAQPELGRDCQLRPHRHGRSQIHRGNARHLCLCRDGGAVEARLRADGGGDPEQGHQRPAACIGRCSICPR